MKKTIYSFSASGLFTGSREKKMKRGVISLPANSTEIEPPKTKRNEHAVWTGEAWEVQTIPVPEKIEQPKKQWVDTGLTENEVKLAKAIQGLTSAHVIDGKKYYGVDADEVLAEMKALKMNPDEYGFIQTVEDETIINDYQLMMFLSVTNGVVGDRKKAKKETDDKAEKAKTNSGKAEK